MAKGLKLILVMVFVLFLLLFPAELRIEARVLKSHGQRENGSILLSRKLPSLRATLSGSSVKYGVVSSEKEGHDKSIRVKHTMNSRSTSPGHSPGVGHVSRNG
ncbi:hypothetical protein AMTR_s00157p00030180 [Amborella trichopoda]|uniref:Uncharacterized protein n=1 Tax=Amborella trichopoda TaxID=13333 RepID=W1PHU7_AMBTC|nr:hypothetical protein AMTR_s00157p00030180 [Amborella trichopoda]